MADLVIKDIRLSLTGAQTLPLAVVLRKSPAYDAQRNFFTVTLKNESGETKKLPFDELRRNVVLVYRNPATGAEIVDNRTPPPKRDGSVEKLASGETKSFQVVFEYPGSIATMKDHVAVLQFCVKWEASWLRAADYTPGAFDWNESFELCQEIRIFDEQPVENASTVR
jgi:hypothetical protein